MKYFKTIKNDISKLHPLPIFIVFIVLTFVFTHSYIDSTNPASRFMTMESLVEEKTFIVNEKHIYTDDKMIRQGNYYSSKPPVLTIIGSGIYYALYNLFDLNLPEKPYFFTINSAVYLITFFLIGSTYLLLLLYFYKTLNLLKIKKRYQILLLAGLGLGTLYLTYSITLNNHTIAGSFLFIGFYYLLKIKINNPDSATQKKYLALAGLFISLSAVIDLPTGLIFLALFFVYAFFTISKKQSVYYIMAAAPIIIIHLFFNYQITGDFLPVQFHPEYDNYKNITWNILGGAKDNIQKNLPSYIIYEENTFLYIFNILFGTHGLFLYSPILLFAIYAIYKIIKNKSRAFLQGLIPSKKMRDKRHQFWIEALFISTGFLIIFLFYVKMQTYTGSAFGFRWFIALTPLLYFFNIFLFLKPPSRKFINGFIIIFIISTAICFVGFLYPWTPHHLIIETPTADYQIGFPLLTNLSLIAQNF